MDFLSMFLNTAKILDLPVDFEKGAKIIGVSSERASGIRAAHFILGSSGGKTVCRRKER